MMCSLQSFRTFASINAVIIDDVPFVDNRVVPPRTAEELRVEAEKRGILKRTLPVETHLTVILLCPTCHERVEVDYDVWCRSELPGNPAHQRFLCKKVSCGGRKYIYHKMGNE